MGGIADEEKRRLVIAEWRGRTEEVGRKHDKRESKRCMETEGE